MKHMIATAPSVLLLEDDRLFADTLADFLGEEGYDVTTVYDPYSAQESTYMSRFDLYLFDINLPFESGLELLKKLREGEDRTPTIFLTSRSDKDSLIRGFDVGGDDYLHKPIDLDELRVRIEAVLRRREGKRRVYLGFYEADVVAKRLYRDGVELELGSRLFDLLMLLAGAHGQTVTTEQILQTLWPPDKTASYGALRVYITRLKKLFGDRIENVRGVGYRYIDREVNRA
jgi:DNA-binding response OmpR family regulator